MRSLEGLRVLFVVPRFFGYERDIKEEIERRGATVDWLPDRPYDTPTLKALTKLRPDFVFPFADRLYERLLEQFAAPSYDYVFVVNGQTLSRRMLSRLRGEYPTARFILYMWDSLANRAHVRENLLQFERVSTFDPVDAKRYGLHLRPLFYGRGFGDAPTSEPHRYHISFVGTAHTDRFLVVDKLRSGLAKDVTAYWYLYLQAPWVLQYYRLTRPGMRHAQPGDFHFAPLSKDRVHTIFAGSRAVLDIEHPLQVGLTMRTFETLGAGKKLVTTNAAVRNYDFYSNDNVCVISRDKPHVSGDFLNAPFAPLSEPLRMRYSIQGWLDEVLEI